MSTVYLAQDLRHDRPVAIKALDPALAAKIGAERFLREIRVAARLNHPHILPLYDSGVVGGSRVEGRGSRVEGVVGLDPGPSTLDPHPSASDLRPSTLYYVMPYVTGGTLRDRIHREGPMALEQALAITREVGGALAAAHEAGIIHRDVKPENILFQGGVALVADFGIATALDAAEWHGAEARLTEADLVLGTPSYMSPEQATAGVDVDGRSDLYSLACVLFEMLTGQPPYRASNTLSLLARHAFDPIPTIATLRSGIPVPVEAALTRAMAKSPRDRFPGVSGFLDALNGSGAAPTQAIAGRAARPPRTALAALPFRDLSPERDQEYLCDGLTEELIDSLSRMHGLQVAARTSCFALKGDTTDVQEIGRKLKVGTVLDGSVRSAGERLRVSVRLTSTSDGFQLWSQRYDRTRANLFDIEDEIVRAVRDQVYGVLTEETPVQPTPGRTADPVAHEYYLKGRHFWNKRTDEGLRQSVKYLRDATEADPDYALAHAALAEALVTLGMYGTLPPIEVMPEAMKAAGRALRLNGMLASARAAQGCARSIFDWDWEAGESDFRRALEYDPREPNAHHWFAITNLVPRRQFDTARHHLDEARSLDPLSLPVQLSSGLLPYYEGDYPAAIARYREALQLNEHFPMTHYFLGQALLELGDLDAAGEALAAAQELSGSPEVTAALGVLAARRNRSGEIEAALAHLAYLGGERYVSPVLAAQIRAAMGDIDGAVNDLLRAAELRAADLVWLTVRPVFAPLRGDPRWPLLCRAVGLDPS